MKTMTYILISLSIIFAHLFACDTGYTEITIDNVADCFYDSDLEVLRKFAENSDADSLDNFNLINDTEGLWTSSPTFVNGRITDLFCYQCDIKGEIPIDIGNLTDLQQLFLYEVDSLAGSIPSSIGSLSKLTGITITNSQIDGTIPSSIGSLNLTLLDLHGNALTGLIPNSICNLSNELSINLSENNLCEPYQDICDNNNINTTQQTGNCASCDVGDLPVDGENCYSETDLDVLISFAATNSELSTEYTDVISMGDQNWAGGKLNFWNCDSCGLEGPILSEIINLTDIDTLDLSNNALSGSIPTNIGSLALTSLDLSYNNLSDSIPPSISSLALTTLNLSNNALSRFIPSDIGSLSLDTLNLSNNALTGITPEDICNYFVLNTSYYNFDNNLLCPPYPECSNTISQNQLPAIDNLLFTFYRDADNDGNGDPEAACPEQFCEDYPPPTGNECEDYVLGPATDTNDACPQGQERDDCGVCGGSGVNDIYACCPTNNNGYDDGTGPDGEEPDQCGVCAGDNTDCSGGYNASTCPSMDQYCNTCFGTNQCLAQLASYEPGSNPIDINTSTIRLHFSVPVDFIGNIATDGIEIESTNGTAPTFSTGVDQDSILTLTLNNPLISSDQVTITLNPCKIKNTSSAQYPAYCLDADKNNVADEIGSSDEYIEIPMTVKLLGDYNSDNDVNQYDLDRLVEKWATDDFSYELGPWTGAEAPYLQPISFSYDGDYNIHDLTGFVLMWNYADGLQRGSMREAELKSTIDFIPEYYFANTKMTLNLEKFPSDIKRIWLQLDARNTNIELDNAVNSSQFDISLHGAHAEYGIYNWTLASFSKLKNKKIDLFNIIHRNESNDQNLKLVYEIVGFNEKISVGELNLVYGSTPEKIIISSPYPNPFNPVTTITYSIAQKSNILVEIYNIQGRLIDKTVTDNTDMGSYTFTWDGTNQPSGIYLIRMKINDTIKNYRTILIK